MTREQKMKGDMQRNFCPFQQIVRERNLYYHPVKNELLRKRRKLAEKKKRITELQKKAIKDLLFQMDTKVIWCNPEKRYIFTKYLIPCLQSGL